jgi:hypothetical protein
MIYTFIFADSIKKSFNNFNVFAELLSALITISRNPLDYLNVQFIKKIILGSFC